MEKVMNWSKGGVGLVPPSRSGQCIGSKRECTKLFRTDFFRTQFLEVIFCTTLPFKN